MTAQAAPIFDPPSQLSAAAPGSLVPPEAGARAGVKNQTIASALATAMTPDRMVKGASFQDQVRRSQV
jgi:hypothetical protein